MGASGSVNESTRRFYRDAFDSCGSQLEWDEFIQLGNGNPLMDGIRAHWAELVARDSGQVRWTKSSSPVIW